MTEIQLIKRVIIGILAFFVIISTVGIIPAGQRGVRLRLGAVTGDVINEGLYFKIPFVENVKRMNVRIQKEEVVATAASKDLQEVSSVIALNFHLDPNEVARIYQEVGMNYDDVIIAPNIQEAVKDSTAQFTAEELITRRSEVRNKIQTLLTEKIALRGIVVDAFNIIDLEFSASFNKAIEAKVTAEQDALAAQNKLKQVEFEAEQKVAKATADAEAIRIQAKAIAQQGGEDYVQLQAIDKWDGVLPVNWYGGSVLPFVNVK